MDVSWRQWAEEERHEDDRYVRFITFSYINFPGCATEWVDMAFDEVFDNGRKIRLTE